MSRGLVKGMVKGMVKAHLAHVREGEQDRQYGERREGGGPPRIRVIRKIEQSMPRATK
jgi:hypothetical protein